MHWTQLQHTLQKLNFHLVCQCYLANELSPRDVANAPIEIKWPNESGALYSLLFVDLDAPSRDLPAYREIAHWLVCNTDPEDIAKGDTVFSYVGSGAPEGKCFFQKFFKN